MNWIIKEGDYLALGATVSKNQVTFTFKGEKEDNCRIVLIHKVTKEKAFISVPEEFSLGSLRSIVVCGLRTQDYNYRYEINGEEQLDPYAKVIVGREIWNDENRKTDKFKVAAGFSIGAYPWGNDKNPEVSKSDMIMYKLHVRGFTMGLKTAGKSRGTFQAVKNKIPYLKDLGITTVEFMPIYEFEEMVIPKEVKVPDYVKLYRDSEECVLPLVAEEKKLNYWGYGEGNYFAVKASYASVPEKASIEFKKLVKALHDNGMECIMEMSFTDKTNHTLIIDALHYWVKEYHVDGFHLVGSNLPIITIEQDSILSHTKIFAENFSPSAYDTKRKYSNLYVYKEEYQYVVRKLVNHHACDMYEFVNQQKKQGEKIGFVNYIASNNGFTLADIFMYNEKHNEANGEDGNDGTDYNLSNNYGIEGFSNKRYLLEIRRKRMRMAYMMLMFAQGVPMIMAGDEFGNTQNGNNNAYCQDNEIGWVNWSQFGKYKADREWLKELIAFRKAQGLINKEVPFRFKDYRSVGTPDLSYHGENAWIPQMDSGKKSIGMLYCGGYAEKNCNTQDIYIGYNFYLKDIKLGLPIIPEKEWYFKGEKVENQQFIELPPHSIYVLLSRETGKKLSMDEE